MTAHIGVGDDGANRPHPGMPARKAASADAVARAVCPLYGQPAAGEDAMADDRHQPNVCGHLRRPDANLERIARRHGGFLHGR